MIDLAKKIQYTNVNYNLTKKQLVDHLETCLEFNFDAAMISPCWIPLAIDILKGSGIGIATTVNFSHATDSCNRISL